MTFSNQRWIETHTDVDVFVNSTYIVSIISEDKIIICVNEYVPYVHILRYVW